ncbi:hypothetical protein ILYODFUR_016057 [Ilyodon furcidens]|uniref:Uncharacterized protein n=1 Tax=Ilyodon furcidens TaxID=33524 RepID=A0ABV0TW59_9TELE
MLIVARSSPSGGRDVTRAEGGVRLSVSRIPQSDRTNRRRSDRTAAAQTGRKETDHFSYDCVYRLWMIISNILPGLRSSSSLACM